MFGNIKIEKQTFDYCKSASLINDIDINEILVSHKIPVVKKVLQILLATKMMKKLKCYA